MKHALFIAPSGELAEPAVYAELAVTAEENGWDGIFFWDHTVRKAPEPPEMADPWICMAVVAQSCSRLRFGPLITPVTRRRPVKLAREVISLDRLSHGRMVLGLGLGVDSHGELSDFGEIVEAEVRGARLTEGAQLLDAFFSGEEVNHVGEHFTATGVRLLPTPVQRPRVPFWFAATGQALGPVRRAARYDGIVPLGLTVDRFRQIVDIVVEQRGDLEGFDIVTRPDAELGYSQLLDLGSTWMLAPLRPGDGLTRALEWASDRPEVGFDRFCA